MQAETIELLRGKFSMEQALVLAEAIERMVEKAQFVTVPILDARIAALTARADTSEAKSGARIELVKAELIARIDAVETRLIARIESVKAELIARIDAVETKLIARIDAVETKLVARIASVEARLDARIDSLEAKLDAKFERWTTRIIIVMVLSQAALGPIGMQAFESMKQVLATLGH